MDATLFEGGAARKVREHCQSWAMVSIMPRVGQEARRGRSVTCCLAHHSPRVGQPLHRRA